MLAMLHGSAWTERSVGDHGHNTMVWTIIDVGYVAW